MNKKVKSALIFILVSAILTILILLAKLASRLPENPADYAGNTGGNLYNRGLFTENDTYIYFANLADNYRLYRMDKSLENVTCIHKDSAEYLNLDAASKNLYYSRINYRQHTGGSTAFDLLSMGIYRLNLKTSGLSRLYKNTCGTVLLAGNHLLYQVHGEDGSYDFYSLSTNTKNTAATLITTEYIMPVSFRNQHVYYAGVGVDHHLYLYSPATGSVSTFADIDCYLPLAAEGGVFFLSQAHNYALYFLPDTSDTATLLIKDRICAYNLSPDNATLFYQIDNGRSNRLCRYDIATETETTILDGDYKNLNTVSDYLFFTDFAETLCYCYDKTTNSVFPFMPSDAE